MGSFDKTSGSSVLLRGSKNTPIKNPKKGQWLLNHHEFIFKLLILVSYVFMLFGLGLILYIVFLQ